MWSLIPSPPHPALSPFIQFYWNGAVPKGETLPVAFLPPTGFTSIILQFGTNPLQLRNYQGNLFTVSKAVLIGQYFNTLEARIPDDFNIVGIMFKPTVLHRFFGFNMQTFTQTLLNADEVFGYDILQLVEQIGNAENDLKRIQHVDEYFIRKFKQEQYSTTTVDNAINLLAANKGIIRVDSIAAHLNFSPRYLQRKFKEVTGVSPKYMGRVMQFNTTLSMFKSNPSISWTDLALRNGYYDQAHFINTFVEFTGANPLQYKRKDNEITQFYLDDQS